MSPNLEKTVKIVVTNAVLSNTGDAAILEGILATLDKEVPASSNDVTILDSDARTTRGLYPDWSIHQQSAVSPPRKIGRIRNRLQRVRLQALHLTTTQPRIRRIVLSSLSRRLFEFSRAVHTLYEADLVISSGGTYLVDHYDFTPKQMELRAAKAWGARVVLWTQSMGPFTSQRSQASIAGLAKDVDDVFFRDDRSAEAWRERAGSSLSGAVVSDVVFALTPQVQPDPAPRALISVREWSRGVDAKSFSHDEYRASMRSAAKCVSEEGLEAVAMSTCQGVPRYAYDDSALAVQYFRGLQVRVDREFHTPRALLSEVANSQLVITTRMHLAIMALLSGVPVIAVAYEFKTLELFQDLGLGEHVRTIEAVSPKWMEEQVQAARSMPSDFILDEGQRHDLAQSAGLPAQLIL